MQAKLGAQPPTIGPPRSASSDPTDAEKRLQKKVQEIVKVIDEQYTFLFSDQNEDGAVDGYNRTLVNMKTSVVFKRSLSAIRMLKTLKTAHPKRYERNATVIKGKVILNKYTHLYVRKIAEKPLKESQWDEALKRINTLLRHPDGIDKKDLAQLNTIKETIKTKKKGRKAGQPMPAAPVTQPPSPPVTPVETSPVESDSESSSNLLSSSSTSVVGEAKEAIPPIKQPRTGTRRSPQRGRGRLGGSSSSSSSSSSSEGHMGRRRGPKRPKNPRGATVAPSQGHGKKPRPLPKAL